MSRYKGRPTGVIFYEGPSKINGEEIVAIATFKTSNDNHSRIFLFENNLSMFFVT